MGVGQPLGTTQAWIPSSLPHSLHGGGQALEHLAKEVPGGLGGGPAMLLGHPPAADRVLGGEAS